MHTIPPSPTKKHRLPLVRFTDHWRLYATNVDYINLEPNNIDLNGRFELASIHIDQFLDQLEATDHHRLNPTADNPLNTEMFSAYRADNTDLRVNIRISTQQSSVIFRFGHESSEIIQHLIDLRIAQQEAAAVEFRSGGDAA